MSVKKKAKKCPTHHHPAVSDSFADRSTNTKSLVGNDFERLCRDKVDKAKISCIVRIPYAIRE
jgi:hypothetical protein